MPQIQQWNSLIKNTKKIIDGLPTAEERQEIINSLSKLIKLLNEIKNSLGTLPTGEEALLAKEALNNLQNVLYDNPLMRSNSSTKRAKQSKEDQVDITKKHAYTDQEIKQLLYHFTELTEDQLRKELTSIKQYPNEKLKILLFQTGRKVPSKRVRRDMIEQLIAAIITRRTYQGLRGT